MKYLTFFAGLLLLLVYTAGFYGCAGISTKTSDQSSVDSSASVDVTGRWTGSFEAQGYGTLPIGMDLKANGDELTGTYDGQYGPVPIRNGKIKGNKISFDVSLDIGMGTPTDFRYKGVVSGNTMDLTWSSQFGTDRATVTR